MAASYPKFDEFQSRVFGEGWMSASDAVDGSPTHRQLWLPV